LPLNRAIELERVLTHAVQVAVDHSRLLGRMLIERDLVRVDESALKTYLGLYANDQSITLSDQQFKAIDRLFELGHDSGLYPERIAAEEMLIPTEYEKKRLS
jgi:1,4-dihydroxy-6-naphthoate synthase